MSIKIGRYEFEGPYGTTGNLQDASGVYAIVDHRPDGKYLVVDVGESANVKSRIETHDRQDCWHRNASGSLKVAVLYTPHLQQVGRMQVEQELRNQYSPACGVR